MKKPYPGLSFKMMNKYISLLRGINVSGQKKIRMIELKGLYEALGLVSVQSYLQSGNVVFDSDMTNTAKLAAIIEGQIELSYGYTVPVFIRDGAEWQRVVAGSPFLTERDEDPASLYVTFLRERPSPSALANLTIPTGESGEFVVGEREIFLFVPGGYGRTKLTNNFFEKKLGLPATTRNWRTVNALYNMLNERQ